MCVIWWIIWLGNQLIVLTSRFYFLCNAITSLLQSDSTFVPIKYPDASERGSGTDSGTDSVNDVSSRSVRFSKLAEVNYL